MATVEGRRALLEARQAELRGARAEQRLSWLRELVDDPRPELVERALRKLGFRSLERDGDAFTVLDGDERVEVTLTPRQLARLVRARQDADWSYADVRPLIRPGAREVPARYSPLGEVVAHEGELPEVRVAGGVAPGTTIAFEVGDSYREWIVDGDTAYVGYPPPAVGARVWVVSERD